MNAAKRQRPVTDEDDKRSNSTETANSSVIYSILNSSPNAFEKELASVTELETLELIQRRADELQRVLEATRQRLQTTTVRKNNVPACHSEASEAYIYPTKTQSALTTSTSSTTRASSMPIEVLRRVTLSGFFTPRELGRLLLWISKSFIKNLGPEIVWDCLFQARWPKMYERLSLHLIQSQGHARLFRQLSAGEREASILACYEIPLPPCRLLENQLVFFVFLKDASGNELFSHILDDQRRHKLLKYGRVKFSLEHERYAADPAEYEKWQTYIHCVRLDTGQSCCLHETLRVKHRVKEARMEPKHMELAMTERGKLLADRIDCYQRTRNSSFVGIRLVAAMLYDEDTVTPFSSSKVLHTLQLDFLKRVFCVDPWRKGGDSSSTFITSVECSSHGVTLLHLLEALDSWV
jgi:hypothetical protein